MIQESHFCVYIHYMKQKTWTTIHTPVFIEPLFRIGDTEKTQMSINEWIKKYGWRHLNILQQYKKGKPVIPDDMEGFWEHLLCEINRNRKTNIDSIWLQF